MATTQDTENSDSVESDEPADDEGAQVGDFEAVKDQLRSEIDAIDEDGEKWMSHQIPTPEEKEEIEEKERQFAQFVSGKLDDFRGTKVNGRKIRVPSSIEIRSAEDAIGALESLDEQLEMGRMRTKFRDLLDNIQEKEREMGYLEMLYEKNLGERFDDLYL